MASSLCFTEDIARLRKVLERNSVTKEDVCEDVLIALLEQHASDKQRSDLVLLDLQDALGIELTVENLDTGQQKRWKELQTSLDTQTEVSFVYECSEQATIYEEIDLEQPSTSGQNIVHAPTLPDKKRKMSDASSDNLPKKPANTTDLIDSEAEFHQTNCNMQPSQCKCTYVSWIWAQLPNAVKSVRSGKWMLFHKKERVDEIWGKVKNLLADSQLGNGAKVSNGEPNTYLICLYTYDFEDVRDVFRVLVTIRRNRLSGDYLNYKTDDATNQGWYTTDQTAQVAGFAMTKKTHSNENVSIYTSPPTGPNTNNAEGDKGLVQLFLNNIGPDYKKGFVAELQEIFYDPPRIIEPARVKRSYTKKDSPRK